MDKTISIYLALGTGVLSSIIAIAVVFITQWFLDRRSIQEYRRGKLEELYLVVIELNDLQGIRYSNYLKMVETDASDDWNNQSNEIEKLYWKIQMYQSLYFKGLSSVYLEAFHFHASLNEIIYRYKHQEIETPSHEDMCRRFASVHDSLSKLRSFIEEISEHLVKKPNKALKQGLKKSSFPLRGL